MRRHLLMLLGVIATVPAVCGNVRADDDEPPPPAAQQEPDVETLVRQLADPRMLVRVAAEHALRRRGPAVLADLPDPATLRPPAADAVRRIRTELQREQAQSALKAGRVTLRGEMTLVEALQAIGDQTGNAVDASNLSTDVAGRRVAVMFDELPFWEAVAQIERQGDLVATCDPQQDAVMLRVADEAEDAPLASTSDGPFRVSVLRVRERMDFVDPDRRLLRTELEVLVEPRLRPLFLHVADAQIEVTATLAAATDAKEQEPAALSFSPLSPSAKREIPIDRPGPIRITHDVVLPQGNLAPPPALVTITGRVEMELAAGQERFEFRHLDEPGRITRRHGGVSVTLESLTHDDEVMDLQLQLRYDADGPGFESHRSWVFHNEAWLSSGEGERMAPADFETLAEGAEGVRLRYRFAGVEGITGGLQFSYTAPTLITRVPITFSLQEVPANR